MQEDEDGPLGELGILCDLMHRGNGLLDRLETAASINNEDLQYRQLAFKEEEEMKECNDVLN